MQTIMKGFFGSICFLFALSSISCSEAGTTRTVGSDIPTVRCKLCPGMEAEEDTLDFIYRVRTFVAQHADKGFLGNRKCQNFHTVPVHEMDMDEYLNIFEQDLGTATCGLVANLMVKILLDNRIDAYTYNFGIDNRLSHVVVVAKCNGLLTVHDPYFNTSLLRLDTTSAPLDLMEFLTDAANGKDEYLLTADTVISDLLVAPGLLTAKQLQPMKQDSCSSWLVNGRMVHDTVYKYDYTRCFRCEADMPCVSSVRRFEAALRQATDLRYYHQAMLYKINPVVGAPDERDVDARIDALLLGLGYATDH